VGRGRVYLGRIQVLEVSPERLGLCCGVGWSRLSGNTSINQQKQYVDLVCQCLTHSPAQMATGRARVCACDGCEAQR
jgi:hypothetical protein